MKKICFVFALFFCQSIFAMEEARVGQLFSFDALVKTLENAKTVEELVKLGAPAAKTEDISMALERKITGVSYKKKCIDLEELCLLKIVHWGFDKKYHIGEMVVNKKIAKEVIEIFTDLLKAKYPVAKIRLIDEYGADDDKSMADNNSCALCCRPITGQEHLKNPTWSTHSYGTAIDINPKQNPYVKPRKNLILPECAKKYVDRTNVRKGMIIEGDACHKAFKSRGWVWGGDWDVNDEKGRIDLQHFHKDLNGTD